ncbi:DUF397 domain-containing protein [Kitasatospora sp. NPDC057223]|uniref:DUF397 domain-containing protein n=1 Tax=Kitasatospora sp. NPDC057223 TaxID=3346055 RepID=UPI0036390D4A
MKYRNGMPAGSIAGPWVKSRVSAQNGQCVELAGADAGQVAFRNSTDPQGPALLFTPGEFAAFLDGAKGGDFDHLLKV